jgi:uncharacterized integral membrane protein (TIGR00698 family)
MTRNIAQIIFPLAALLTLTPWISSAIALMMGVALALTLENPYSVQVKKYTHHLLGYSVMGLGAGMNLAVVMKVGFEGIGYTVAGIVIAAIIGTLLGKFLKTPRDTSILITVGTAICGGSAIAAVAPVLRAKHHEVSVALGTVFTLNALALIIFPSIGHHFNLSESQFGLWCALAIHDTSSVVGASMQYGAHALEVGTTIKLARALWIIPVAMIVGFFVSKYDKTETGAAKAKKPWFILGFIIVAGIVTWLPELRAIGHQIEMVAKKTLVLTLFLIGSGLTKETIKSVGFKPFIQGFFLWIIMAAGTLLIITLNPTI